jgi:hypothetical protein
MATRAKTANDMSAWASDIDTDATRALIEELQAEGKPWDKLESKDNKYITNYRRICPKRPDWSNPYQIVPVHYLGPQNRMTVCLKESGLGECPACQLRWQLKDGGDEQGSQRLRSSIRTFLNVVHIKQDGSLAEDKVFLMGLNQLQFMGRRGVEYDLDEEGDLPLFYFFEKYGDLSHVETGRDLLIKAKSETVKMGDGTVEMLVLKFSAADPSPFPGTGELLEEGLTDLQEVVPVVEPTEMVALIEGRATGAVMLNTGTSGDAPAQATAPAEAEVPPKNRFGGEDPEEEAEAAVAEAAVEPEAAGAEEKPDNPKAGTAPPKTDPKAAIARLRKSQEK